MSLKTVRCREVDKDVKIEFPQKVKTARHGRNRDVVSLPLGMPSCTEDCRHKNDQKTCPLLMGLFNHLQN